MSGRKNMLIAFGFAVSVGLIAAAVSVLAASYHYSRLQFDLLNAVCGEVVEQAPETGKIIAAALKEYAGGNFKATKEDVLSVLGYQISDFSDFTRGQGVLFIVTGLMAGILLFLFTYLYRNRTEVIRIRALAEYLEQVNTGKAAVLSASGEDDFSKLEDEIYKTVTYLYKTKDSAVQAKNAFAENLSNIAHQIKTPITAISLSVQMMKRNIVECATLCMDCEAEGGMSGHALEGEHHAQESESHALEGEEHALESDNFQGKHLEQVERQLMRLTRLEEALLVLSRMDAGTIRLRRDEVDVFTLLVLAADNMQELCVSSRTAVDIPEQGGMLVIADLDWTMEAVMNLMKNCMEHSPGGTVHCSYAQNPLYTEILIWDEGEGFAREDLPHIFERFYRGRNACEGGIGIGLALSKEIIERQNGTLRARNRADGGALFEIRFYSH